MRILIFPNPEDSSVHFQDAHILITATSETTWQPIPSCFTIIIQTLEGKEFDLLRNSFFLNASFYQNCPSRHHGGMAQCKALKHHLRPWLAHWLSEHSCFFLKSSKTIIKLSFSSLSSTKISSSLAERNINAKGNHFFLSSQINWTLFFQNLQHPLIPCYSKCDLGAQPGPAEADLPFSRTSMRQPLSSVLGLSKEVVYFPECGRCMH